MSVTSLVLDQVIQLKFGGAAAFAISLFGVMKKGRGPDATPHINCTVIGVLLILALLLHSRA